MAHQLIPVVSLFSGPGGMDLGFREQGFVPILAVDIDQAAVDTYNWNNKRGIARQGDLSKLSDAEIISFIRESAPGVRPRGVIGGPPCQSFSIKWSAKSSLTKDQLVSQKLPDSTPALTNRSRRLKE